MHPDWLKLPLMEARGDWPMVPRKTASREPLVSYTGRARRTLAPARVTMGQYLVQMRNAELMMQAYVDRMLAENPGWKLLPSGQFVDADGNDVGIWIE